MAEQETKNSKTTWWQTLPGMVTAAAALITAVAGAVVGLHQGGNSREPKKSNETPSTNISDQGRVGDELTTLQWSFQVLRVSETDEYMERYYQAQRLIRPQGSGDTLIVVDARLKNRLQKTQSPVLMERVPGNTGLIDDVGHSYQPLDYDARQQTDKTQSSEGAPLLPGTEADFALVFSVPRGTKPKSLVVTLKNYKDFSEAGTDVKVSLKR